MILKTKVSEIDDILASLNQIEKQRIVPTNVSEKLFREKSEFNHFDANNVPCFPLEWFDFDANVDNDEKYFSQSNEGYAFLPVQRYQKSSQSTDFSWQKVIIHSYSHDSNKWLIENVRHVSYEVPRIYLIFSAESPRKFLQRIQDSLRNREICERKLRFEMVLNEFPMNRIPQLFVHFHDKIEKLLDMSETKMELMEFYQRESCIVFQKVLIAQQLIKFINERKSSSEYLKQQKKIELPRKCNVERKFLRIGCQNNNINGDLGQLRRHKKESERNLKQLWLYCCPQAIKIMEFINNECRIVRRMSFFHLQTSEPCDWKTFCDENNSKLQSMSIFLKSKWIDTIVNEIQSQLSDVGKGWYDMSSIDSWPMYKMTKLYRLLGLIRKHMELAIMKSLKSSLTAFVNHLCRPCECLLHIPNDYVWLDDDLVNSPFRTEYFRFTITLNLDNTTKMPIYSISELQNGRLMRDILNLYDECMLTSHDIPQIDPYLIQKLKFDVKSLRLTSIGLLDVDVQNQIIRLQESYSKCLVALQAYAKSMKQFIKSKSLNCKKDIPSSAAEMEQEIYQQEELAEQLRLKLPDEIIIGPFLVSNLEMKLKYIKDCTDAVEVIKENLVVTTNNKVSIIQQRYDAIMKRLTEKPINIENLDDIRSWLPTIPQLLNEIQRDVRLVTNDFRIIDSFLLVLPDDVFVAKWTCLQMPQTITLQITETQRIQEMDVVRFRKMHSSDITVYNEKIVDVFFEVESCLEREVENEMLSLWTKLRETKDHVDMLNRRCLLFGQEEIETERLDECIDIVRPYHKFWSMTLNFRDSKNLWMLQTPLLRLDKETIEAEIESYEAIAEESREHFADNEKMISHIDEIALDMKKFKESIVILKDIKHPDLNKTRLVKLMSQIGIKFDEEVTTIEGIILYGVPRFLRLLQEIVKEVFMEAERQRQLEAQRAIEETKRRQQEEEVKKYREIRRGQRKDLFG